MATDYLPFFMTSSDFTALSIAHYTAKHHIEQCCRPSVALTFGILANPARGRRARVAGPRGVSIKTQHNGLLWMPTVHREGGFRFIIFFKDHGPAHVHVWHAGSVAKMTIGDATDPPLVADPGMMRTPELRDALRIVETRQEQFLTAWREIHGA